MNQDHSEQQDPPPADEDSPPPWPQDQDPQSPDASAKVRFRIKGQEEGPVFQGQTIIVPCLNCGRK